MNDDGASWVRKCPLCQVEIFYKSRATRNQAENRNRRVPARCRACRKQLTRSTMQTTEFRKEQSVRVSQALKDPTNTFGSVEHRQKVADKVRSRSPEVAAFVIERSHTPEANEKRILSLQETWKNDPDRRERQGQLFKDLMKDPEHRAKCIEPWFEASLRSGGSSKIEKRLVALLSPLGWKHQEKFLTYHVDLTNHDNKIIVELYGHWWHCHPKNDEWIVKHYSNLHPIVKKSPAEIRERDRKRLETIAESSGYRIFVVWDHEIKSLSDEQIIEFLKQRSIL